jgi:cytochrome c oxidase cbb3-type subunit 4
MDINELRSLVTLIGFLLFVGLMAWTWRPSGREAHEAAALLPFAEADARPLPAGHDAPATADKTGVPQ